MELWHFTADTLRDGRPIPAIGEWLVHDGEIMIRRSGLHASERLIDALQFAPGNRLHRVTMRRIEGRESDKIVARERRIEWSIDAEPVLRAFARRCALDVLPLWPDAPAVVREYLETGREDIRSAARDAARAAAVAAEGPAAWAAACATAPVTVPGTDAARAAAWAPGRHIRPVAARAAARDAILGKYDGWVVAMVEAAR